MSEEGRRWESLREEHEIIEALTITNVDDDKSKSKHGAADVECHDDNTGADIRGRA